MKRVHSMPFGAELRPDGVRFSLWSPSAKRVALLIGDETPREMPIDGDGWASQFAPGLRAGARYRFMVEGQFEVPDPASRFQPDGPLAASMVVDPAAFAWSDSEWRGRPWEEAVLLEAHVGIGTAGGTYADLADKLPELAELGVTAIELMPLSDCPGARNWGYDGVLPFAPNHAYGSPDDLKRLICRAHELELMVVLDVVYNHFGPGGNYLNVYAAAFFNQQATTPWGAAINFDGEHSGPVREFFIHNALYWLEEFHFDGLRLDAVHAFVDHGEPPFLAELAERVRDRFPSREIHLILENERNEARWLVRRDGKARLYTAQWNDDLHHCWHRLLTNESDGYYEDFDEPARQLGCALAEGFVYQGEPSKHQSGKGRGEKSAHLPPSAFVDFLQNHDQVGNRALGERLSQLADPRRLAAAQAALLLAPHIPLLFIGEPWDASSPFQFFVDFAEDPALSKAVRDGRRQEFSRFASFADPERIPDPTAPETFARSKLDWTEIAREPHRSRFQTVGNLLRLRRERVTPLAASGFISGQYALAPSGVLEVVWRFQSGDLRFLINFGSMARISQKVGETVFWIGSAARIEANAIALENWGAAFASQIRDA